MTDRPASPARQPSQRCRHHESASRVSRPAREFTGTEQCVPLVIPSLAARAGCGLAVLGMLMGSLCLMGASEGGPLKGQSWGRASVEAAIVFMAFALAGWAVAALSRLIAAVILEHLERANNTSDRFAVQAAEAVALLERMTVAMENGGRLATTKPRRRSIVRVRWPRS